MSLISFLFYLETVRIEFEIRNTLQVTLLLSELQILWKYSSTGTKRKTSVSTENIEETKEFTNDTVTKQVTIIKRLFFVERRTCLHLFRQIHLLNVIFFLIVLFFQTIHRK